MRFFVCLLSQSGIPIPDERRQPYEAAARAHGLQVRWQNIGSVSALLAHDEPSDDSMLARDESSIAVGIVRLDNRADLERWASCADPELSGLQLVVRLIRQHGTEYIPRILGDFAFVAWDLTTGVAIAACDAFAVKKLYYAARGDLLAFASRAEALALSEQYDVQYLAELAAYSDLSVGHSPYEGVYSLPAGAMAIAERGTPRIRRYWSAYDVARHPPSVRSEGEAVEACRELLAAAVRTRLTGRQDTWAQLSGGLDSSSVVSMAQGLNESGAVPEGLAGTVTWVHSHGTGADEREYSDAVVRRFRLRNEVMMDCGIWEDDECGPPRLDHPVGGYAFYPRYQQLRTIVRGAGGRALLTGLGGDELFSGNMLFFADWIASGRVLPAVREMARRAAIGRVSLWELGYKNAVLPLLPHIVQRALVKETGRTPPWIEQSAVRRYDLSSRAFAPRSYAGRWGRKYSDAVAAGVDSIPVKLSTGLLEDALDVRHPFLYRPLVEFALRLPPELCVRPYARKWVLREAMRGLLPDIVRARIGKGTLHGVLAWSVVNRRSYIEPLLENPILAQLGIVDLAKFRAGFEAAQYEHHKDEQLYADVQYTLALEAWLQVRSGRWPCGQHQQVQELQSNRTSD